MGGHRGPPLYGLFDGTEQARDLLLISEGADDFKNEMMHEQLTAKGSMAWARFIKGEFERGCLIGGTRFEMASRLKINSPTTVSCCAVQIYEDRVELLFMARPGLTYPLISPR